MTDTLVRLKAALANRYAIEYELGSGGMATVYLAEDLKHHRKVAVKVLRPDLAAALGPERFMREIEIAANLTHPHIVPLYDSGEADGFLYYVLPYIEGESLRAKLAREGELPIADAVRILRDVVDALTDAHAHGVVHRDIKPDNVLLTKHHAVVTDFGVAKAVSEATGRAKLTTAGVALGTPAYMAPEQATGESHIDHRADIYSVGALAYELLTGRTPFTGTTSQMILAAHVTEIPEPVTKHRRAVPHVMEHLVMKCLEKKPADRWQSAEELLPQLEALATPSGGVTPTDTKPVDAVSRPLANRTMMLGGLAAVLVAGVVGVLLVNRGPEVISIGQTQQMTRAPGMEIHPALSPDGDMAAYAAGPLGTMNVFVRQVAGGDAISLTDDMPGHNTSPKWSPDGAQIVFRSAPSVAEAGAIYVVPALGGTPRLVVDAPAVSPTWSPDGDEIAYIAADTIFARALSGGQTRVVAKGSLLHSLAWSPDGSRLAYVAGENEVSWGLIGSIGPTTIWVVSTRGGEPTLAIGGGAQNLSPVWSADGRDLLFISNESGTADVYQVRINADGEPAGEPIRVTVGLNAQSISLAASGTRMSYSRIDLRNNLWSIEIPDRGATSISAAQPLTFGNQTIEGVDLSPDGEWLVFDSNRSGNQDIYKMPSGGGEATQLTTNPADDFDPSWSFDGSEIVFHSARSGDRDIFVTTADGRSERQITRHPARDAFGVLSPDGELLAFTSFRSGRPELWMLSRTEAGGWGTPRQVTSDGGDRAKWSPNGRFIVYLNDNAVWLIARDGGDPQLVISGVDETGSDTSRPLAAVWSGDGRIIYFLFDDGSFWSIPTEGGDPTPLVVFDSPLFQSRQFEFASDDQRFYFTMSQQESDVWVMEVGSN